MNLVQRYIDAIKFWLPSTTKDDIGAELAEDIRSEIEEREAETGRPLNETEIEALLKARGAPLNVASRYLPQRSLIGPEIFPVYLLVLKIVAFVCLIPAVIGLVTSIGFGPGHLPLDWVMSPLSSLVTAFGIVTLVFAVIEHKGIMTSKMAEFEPGKLPKLHAPKGTISRSDLVGEIAASLVLVWLFLAGYLSKSEYTEFGWHVVLAPEWVTYWQTATALALAETTFSAVLLFRPVWTAPSILARLALDTVKIGVFGWLLSHNVLRDVSLNHHSDFDIVNLLSGSELAARYAGAVTTVLIGCVCLAAVVRFVRISRGHTPLPA